MLNLISVKGAELGVELKLRLAKYRHEVFIRELGWSIPTVDDQEFDQFDHAETMYVIATDDTSAVVGCARLLTTDQPYLLGEIFPTLMGGAPLPCTAEIWELSRFAISMPGTENPCSKQAWENTCSLMSKIVKIADLHGVVRLIAFSVLGNERLLRKMGVNVHRAAPPQLIDGKPTLPFWVEIDDQTRGALGLDSRAHGRILAPRGIPTASEIDFIECVD